jgi:hypothetical protein
MTAARTVKADTVGVHAADAARAALLEAVDATDVGDHLGHTAEDERVVTHFFECRSAGYRGWRWAVTVARAPRSRSVTVDEIVLLPGEDAIVAPEWVPYRERLQPGDLSPGDILPTDEDDPRLVPTYLTGDPGDEVVDQDLVRDVVDEIGLGRVRVLSLEGRELAAQRWYDGDHGPDAAISVAAPAAARCGTCGFYLPLAGALRQSFGACGNFYAPDDGRVVSADHGCGAHSETLIEAAESPVDELPTVYDDSAVEAVSVSRAPGSVEAAEPAEPYGHP